MKKQLKFRDDGTFKIVQIADLHYEGGQPEDLRTIACIETVLAAEQPDFVAFTGDAVKGNRCADQLAQFLEIMALPEKYGIPYGFAFGNHDSEHDMCTREEMMEAASSRELCYAEVGPEEASGVGNYVVPICGARDDETKALLYFFDTGCSAPKHITKGYAWIQRDQIDWYMRKSAEFAEAAGGPLPALAFFHIPFPEYKEVWDLHISYGHRNEGNGIPKLNSGMFSAMKTMGDIMGTFVGHDHTNNYCGELHGIRLCYGQTGGYNKVGDAEYPRGARVIELREGVRGFDTWIRMADGSIITDQPEHYPTGSEPQFENRGEKKSVLLPKNEQEAYELLLSNFRTLDWEVRRRQLVREAIDYPALLQQVPPQLKSVVWSGVNIEALALLDQWWNSRSSASMAGECINEASSQFATPAVGKLAALLRAVYAEGQRSDSIPLSYRSEEGTTDGGDLQLQPGRYGALCRMSIQPEIHPYARVQLQLKLKDESGNALAVLVSEQEHVKEHEGKDVMIYLIGDVPEQVDSVPVHSAQLIARLKDCRDNQVEPQVIALCQL